MVLTSNIQKSPGKGSCNSIPGRQYPSRYGAAKPQEGGSSYDLIPVIHAVVEGSNREKKYY